MECNVCGAKSVTVSDRYQMTVLERQALREFMVEHQKCATTREGFFPEHAVAARPVDYKPPTCGAFGSEKSAPRSVSKPHGHFEYTGPYGEVQQGDTISCCHCLAFDTKILTRFGVKDIANVEVGDEVMDNFGNLTTVRQLHKRTVPCFYRIETRGGGEPLLVSDEHPLWALRAHYVPREWAKLGKITGSSADWIPGHFRVDEQPSFVQAKDISLGMWLALPRLAGEVEPSDFCRSPFDEEMARFIGLFLAEGWVGRDVLAFGFHKKETQHIDFVRSFAKRRWNANCCEQPYENGQTFKLTVCCAELEQPFLLNFGKHAANKRMPFTFLLYPNRIQEALMSGLLDGDGCRPKNRPCRQLSTISPHLAYQSTAILRRLGYHPNVTSRAAYTDTNGSEHQKEYKVTFGINSERRKRVVQRHFVHQGYTWVKVMRVERINAELPVFNLSTDSETFVANGYATHNCRRHWEMRAGLEKQLGFCALCYNGTTGSGTTCGSAACQEHIPFELRLENVEAGRPVLTPKAPQVAVPASLGGAVILEPPAPISSINTLEVACGSDNTSE